MSTKKEVKSRETKSSGIDLTGATTGRAGIGSTFDHIPEITDPDNASSVRGSSRKALLKLVGSDSAFVGFILPSKAGDKVYNRYVITESSNVSSENLETLKSMSNLLIIKGKVLVDKTRNLKFSKKAERLNA